MAHRILLIDDDEAVLDVFQLLLTSRNYIVDCARDMKEAEEHLGQDHNKYSVVIADLCLTHGEMEGLQVLEYISRQPFKPRIVVCSGNANSDVREKVRIMGADMFLTKPFIFKTFLEELGNLLNDALPPGAVQSVNNAGTSMRHAIDA
jgi:DNA-binding response OmpR family regulator